MIIMALDHVRDYFHADTFLYDPLDLDKTTPFLFFTRWITHLCAPLFIFLAGVSANITGQKKTKSALKIFLVKRGIWLVILELTVINVGWGFNLLLPNFLLVTVWDIGISMVILAGLIYLPKSVIFLISVLLIMGHNLFDNFHVEGNNIEAFGWAFLHEQKLFTWHGFDILLGYPIISLFPLMALGYLFGDFYKSNYDINKRSTQIFKIAIGLIAAFVFIRFLNIYGDPQPWTSQKNLLYTFLSFMKVNKYPPSLLYVLITLGIGILFLSISEKWRGKAVDIISVYGRVPMFFYILHIYLIHFLAMVFSELFTTVSWENWILNKPIWFDPSLKGGGFQLWVVYLVWAFVIVVLYPFCKKYDTYKQAHKEKWWLSYL